MKSLIIALVSGLVVAAVKYQLLLHNLTYWDLTLVSISGLMAGIFFILAMTFRAALQDYKRAEITIATIRSKILSLNDVNIVVAKNIGDSLNPAPYGDMLKDVCAYIKGYITLRYSFVELSKKLDELNRKFWELHKHMTPQHVRVQLGHQDNLREAISQLASIKDLHFSKIGYFFLYGFVAILITLQLFAHSDNVILEMVFIFSLTTVLVFFADLIRDLDNCLKKRFGSFAIDTLPLENTIKAIDIAIEDYKK